MLIWQHQWVHHEVQDGICLLPQFAGLQGFRNFFTTDLKGTIKNCAPMRGSSQVYIGTDFAAGGNFILAFKAVPNGDFEIWFLYAVYGNIYAPTNSIHYIGMPRFDDDDVELAPANREIYTMLYLSMRGAIYYVSHWTPYRT